MEKLILPMSAENFAENWSAVDSRRRIAKKKYVTCTLASFFSNMVFALLAVIVSNGLIHDHLSGSYCNFLIKVPYLLPVWDQIKALILKPDFSLALRIAIPLVAMYAVCFAVCGIFVLIVTLLYHPFKRKIPTSTVKENASQMLTMARDARRYSRRTGSNGSLVWALFFMMVQFALIALYWLIELQDMGVIFQTVISPVMKVLEPYIQNFNSTQRMGLETAISTPSTMLLIMGIYLAYSLADQIHALSVRFMYQYRVPYSFVAEVEYYYTFADEKTEGMTDEEIKEKRKEAAEAKRIQALDLERIGAYGKAKELLAEAAHGGDSAAMEHYGRHWLVINAKDPGKYWLQKCVDTGEAGEYAVKTLRRLKWHLKVQAKHLK